MRKSSAVFTYDSPLEIEKCLNCKFTNCFNCLAGEKKGKPRAGKPRAGQSKRVAVYDMAGNLLAEYDSITDAARAGGKPRQNVSKAAREGKPYCGKIYKICAKTNF